jgi:hypothetical protein
MTVGLEEVDRKRKDWRKLGKEGRRRAMNEEMFPAVKASDGFYYILDNHHTALALIHEKTDTVRIGLVKDLSELTSRHFWVFLDHHSWMHAYDEHGRRRPFRDMPRRFEDMRDDPYRSLAKAVRDAGGFAKPDEPFLEFLWANHFRDLIPKKLLASKKRALSEALDLAASKRSQHLPGWVGKK